MARPLWLAKLLVRTGIARFLPAARRLTDDGTAFLRYYSDRVLAAPVEELLDPAFVPPPADADVIDLNLAAPRFESAVSVGRVAETAGRPPASGTAELRNAITDLYVRRDGRAVDPDREVFVTHGATAAYAAALDAFVNPGDRVVLFDPCSPLFALGARSRRAAVRWVPTWNEDGRCRFLTAGFERQVRRAKLLVLSDPANPTGAGFTTDDFEYVLWIASAYDVLVYVDESFGRFRYAGRSRSPAVLPGGDGRVLTAGSVSQGYGLGAVRVGWLAGPRHLVRACTLTANLSAPYVPAVCQRLSARALGETDAEFAPALEEFRSRRDYTLDRLRAMGLEPDAPAGGYFVWVPVAGLGLDGRAFAAGLLKSQRVLVGPGCAFGPSGAGHVRVSFAADDGRLREGLARLAAFVASRRKPTPAPVAGDAEEAAPNPEEAPRPVFTRA